MQTTSASRSGATTISGSKGSSGRPIPARPAARSPARARPITASSTTTRHPPALRGRVDALAAARATERRPRARPPEAGTEHDRRDEQRGRLQRSRDFAGQREPGHDEGAAAPSAAGSTPDEQPLEPEQTALLAVGRPTGGQQPQGGTPTLEHHPAAEHQHRHGDAERARRQHREHRRERAALADSGLQRRDGVGMEAQRSGVEDRLLGARSVWLVLVKRRRPASTSGAVSAVIASTSNGYQVGGEQVVETRGVSHPARRIPSA